MNANNQQSSFETHWVNTKTIADVTIDEESWLVEAGLFLALVGLVEYFAKNFFMKKK